MRIRLAVDLTDSSEIGRFQYSDPQERVALPSVGDRLALDTQSRYLIETTLVTPSWDDDTEATHLAWGRLCSPTAVEADDLWDHVRPAFFQSFTVDGKEMTAAELVAHDEMMKARATRRDKSKQALNALILGIVATAAYENRDAAVHLMHLSIDDVLTILRSLGR